MRRYVSKHKEFMKYAKDERWIRNTKPMFQIFLLYDYFLVS